MTIVSTTLLLGTLLGAPSPSSLPTPPATSSAPARTLAPTVAHAVGEDYVWMNFLASSIEGRFEINLSDLEEKLGLALLVDSATALQRVEATAGQVEAYIRSRFAIGPVDGEPWTIEFLPGRELTELQDETFAQYPFRIDTGPLPDRLAIQHEMLYEGDKLHRGLLMVEYVEMTGTEYPPEYTALVFSPMNTEQVLDLTDVGGLLTPWDMIPQGVLHIWIGIDHILFLLALMLPTVLRLENGRWQPVERFSSALWNLLKIVTVFTVAHSITLALAALDLLSVPSRLVESVIALSIVLVALNNVKPRVRDASLVVILILGLFHGMGFASVMGVLPFRMVDLLKSVVGFNIGVELGQAAIVLAVFPVLYALRNSSYYRPLVLQGASVVLMLIAGWWFVQRALGFA